MFDCTVRLYRNHEESKSVNYIEPIFKVCKIDAYEFHLKLCQLLLRNICSKRVTHFERHRSMLLIRGDLQTTARQNTTPASTPKPSVHRQVRSMTNRPPHACKMLHSNGGKYCYQLIIAYQTRIRCLMIRENRPALESPNYIIRARPDAG